MPTRLIQMRILTSGDVKAKATLDELAATARALGKLDPTIEPNVKDDKATARLKDLKLKVDILARTRFDMLGELKDEKMKGQLLGLNAQIRGIDALLNDKNRKFTIADLEKTESRMIRLKLTMDSMHNKTVDLNIKAKADMSSFAKLKAYMGGTGSIMDLFKGGGGGSGGGGSGGSGGGALSGLLSGGVGQGLASAGPYGIAAIAALIGALLPGITGLSAGLGVGAIGAGGSLMAGSLLQSQIGTLRGQIASAQSATTSQQTLGATIAQLQRRIAQGQAPGATKAQIAAVPGLQTTLGIDKTRFANAQALLPATQLGLASNQQNLARDMKLLPQFSATSAAFGNVTSAALTTFATATAPIQKPLQNIFAGLVPQIKALAPMMTEMFKASLPFVKMFADLMLQVSKVLMPAFTVAMDQMVKSGALKDMMTGLIALIKGIAGLIVIMGPEMKVSALVFVVVMRTIQGALLLIGLAIDTVLTVFRYVGKAIGTIVKVIADVITGNFGAAGRALADWVHNVMRLFGEMRHAIAVALDSMGLGPFGHSLASIFNRIRHDVAAAWDATWKWVSGRFASFVSYEVGEYKNFWHHVTSTFDGIRHDVAAIWAAIWGPLLHAFDNFKHALLKGFNETTHLVSAVWRQFWESTVGNWFKHGFDLITHWLDIFRHNLSAGFMEIGHNIRVIWDATWSAVWTILSGKAKALNRLVQDLSHWLNQTMDNIRHAITTIWDSAWNYLFGRATVGKGKVTGVFDGFFRSIKNGFNDAGNWIHNVWSNIWGKVEDITHSAVHQVGALLHGLEHAFGDPIAWVVNHALDPLVSIWDTIVGAIGQKNLQFHLPTFKFAEGGKVTAGTGPKSDNVLALVSKGETVVSAQHSSQLASVFSAVGVPGYAAGGIPNPGRGGVLGAGNPTGSPFSVGDILGWLMKPLGFLISHAFGGVLGLLGGIPGAHGIATLLRGMVTTLVTDAASGVKKNTPAMGGMGDSGARTRSAAVAQAFAASLMSMYGWSQGQMSSLIPLWNQESGWSAYAVNPSSGAYGIPQSLGHGHPYNLGDYKNQIIWGLNYIRGRYGSPASAENHERAFNWYGKGGWINEPVIGRGLRSGQSYGFGELGPELVTPRGGMTSGGGATIYHITVHAGTLAHPADTGREVVNAIKQFENRSGKSWRK